MFVETSELNANNVDPDQTPRSVVSRPGLYCLPVSLYGTLDINELASYLTLLKDMQSNAVKQQKKDRENRF